MDVFPLSRWESRRVAVATVRVRGPTQFPTPHSLHRVRCNPGRGEVSAAIDRLLGCWYSVLGSRFSVFCFLFSAFCFSLRLPDEPRKEVESLQEGGLLHASVTEKIPDLFIMR